MIGPAPKEHDSAALPGNGSNNSQGQIERLQYGPLLDMELQISDGGISRASIGDQRGI